MSAAGTGLVVTLGSSDIRSIATTDHRTIRCATFFIVFSLELVAGLKQSKYLKWLNCHDKVW